MPANQTTTDDMSQTQQPEAAAPLFDMSKAQPIQDSQPAQSTAKPLFDMSKATAIQAPNSEEAFRARRAAGVGVNPALNTGTSEGPTGAAGVASGFANAVASDASGVNTLIKAGTGIDIGGMASHIPGVTTPSQSDLENRTPSQKVGGGAEDILGWIAGDEALKGLTSLVKAPQAVLEILEKYPKASKIITGMAKGATVGGTQGAVKGAAEGDATGGAIGGAAGGAIGGTVAEGIGPGLKTLGKVFGLGLDSEEALVRGVKPTVGEDANFRKALQTAEPRIVEAAKADPPKTVADFEDLLHNKAQDIRQNEFGPMIQRNAKQMVSAQPVAANIRSAITDQMREYAPDEAKELEDFAVKFSKDMPLGKAESDLQYFNAQLKKFYKANAVDQSAALKTNGTVAKYEAAADGLRDLIYGRLKELGENAPEDLQRQYGALKTLERSFAKRATVSERQNPLNLTEIMGLLAGAGEAGTAIAAGHPLAAVAGVLPYAAAKTAKVLNSSDSLVKRGVQSMVKDAGPAGAFQKIAPTAGSVLKTGTAAGAAAFGANEWVKVQDSNGQQWEVHPSDLAQMQQKDPGVQLVQPN